MSFQGQENVRQEARQQQNTYKTSVANYPLQLIMETLSF